MEFYVKRDGKLVKATQDEILSTDTVLYNAAGKCLDDSPAAPEAKNDPIEELTGLVREMATTANESFAKITDGIKEREDKMMAELAAFKETARKGLPLPSGEGAGRNVTTGRGMIPYADGDEKLCAPFNLAVQGQKIFDKLHNSPKIAEERRKTIAKCLTMFLKASVFKDDFPEARGQYRDIYGVYRYGDSVAKLNSTDIGDTGNTFPLPDILEDVIVHFAREKSVVMQDAEIWPMVSEKDSVPVEGADALTAGWGNTTYEDNPTATEVELDAEELSAYCSVKNRTLADARVDIVSWIMGKLAEAAALAIDQEAFTGDGTSVCSGMFTSASNSVTMASALFSSLTFANLSSAVAALDGLRKEGAKWYMNGALLHYVRILSDDNGRPIFLESAADPDKQTILGYPWRECVKCPSTDGATKNAILFGNMKYFALGRRLDSTALQADPYGLWTTNRTRFKLYQRWGMQVAQAAAFVKIITHA